MLNRKYFYMLFRAFLSVSVIPLLFCSIVILVMMHAVTVSQYQQTTSDILKTESEKLDHVFVEYDHIVNSMAENEAVRKTLSEDLPMDNQNMNQMISLLMTGRRDKFQVTVLDTTRKDAYCSGSICRLYDLSVYSGWGIFRAIQNDLTKTALVPQCFYSSTGQKVVLSMGRAVLEKNGRVLGYVILDVYRDSLLEASAENDNPYANYIIADENSISVLNTLNSSDEGKELPDNIFRIGTSNSYNIMVNGKMENFVSRSQIVTDNLGLSGNLSIVAIVPAIGFVSIQKNLVLISAIVICFVFLGCVLISRKITKQIYRPVEVLVKAMEEVERGNLDAQVPINPNSSDEVTAVGRCFNRMIRQINELLQDVVEQTKRQSLAELKALQAQISPHFLYNMLNEIKSLAKLGRMQDVSEFAVQLGKLLRGSINCKENNVTVEEDMKLIEAYLKLQSIRYEGNFQYELQLEPEALSCKIPAFILQPVVENAVLHGLNGRAGMISITGVIREEKLLLEVYDNGDGMDETLVQQLIECTNKETLYGGMGLKNIQRRLELLYGPPYGIRIESKPRTATDPNSYTKIVIIFPCNR